MKIIRFLPALLLALAIIFFMPPITNAQETCIHNGTAWNNAALWSCGRVPLITDDVIIPDDGVTSILNTDGFAASLTVNGTLHIGSNNSARTLRVDGDVTIANTGTLVPNSAGGSPIHTLLIGGDIVNNGTLDLRSAASVVGTAVVNTSLNGFTLQHIAGTNSIRFNTVTVANDATVAVETQPTVEGSLTNNGTLAENRIVNNAAVEFLHILNLVGDTTKYRGADIETINDLGQVTVSVQGVDTGSSEYCTSAGGTSPTYAERCYTITAGNPSNDALVRLWASQAELNTLDETTLTPYHWNGAAWVELTNVVRGNDGGDYYYGEGDTTSFSSFLLGGDQNPTAVSLANISITNSGLSSLWLGLGLLILLTLAVFWRQLRSAKIRSL